MIQIVKRLTRVVLTAVALPAVAAPALFTISAEQVSSAISDAGMPVSPAQVTFFTRVRATTDAPRLKVQSIHNSGDRSAIVRMECESPGQCLPFLVKAQLSQYGGSITAKPILPQDLPAAMGAGSKPIVIRAGSQAILLLDGERIHIRIPVTCIENGTLGARVRVRASDNRQLYLAEVVDATSVKGSL
jgi:hypothetical protein